MGAIGFILGTLAGLLLAALAIGTVTCVALSVEKAVRWLRRRAESRRNAYLALLGARPRYRAG